MLLYKYQVIKLARHNEPAIYLGFDTKQQNKIWAVGLDNSGNPEIDWHLETNLEYYKIKSTLPGATPKDTQIFYGKFKQNLPNHMYMNKLSEEDFKKLADYVSELIEKYQKDDEKK